MKKVLIFILLILFVVTIEAQGLIFDTIEYAKREKIEETRTELPISASLKQYTPVLYPQVGSTCVALSFANARTILLAKKLNWTGKQKITGLSFSPYYIYYRNKESNDSTCKRGLNIEAVARDVLKNGIAPIIDVEYPNYYPFTDKALCLERKGTYPSFMENALVSAKKYKIDEVYKVASLLQLKTALAGGIPVIICMYTPQSFTKVKGDIWVPSSTDKLNKNNGHTLIAVSYNDTKYDGAIEVMNSWGETWGNKGFIWIRYKDYSRWFIGGYALYVNNNMLQPAEKTEIKPETSKLGKKIMKVNNSISKKSIKFDNSEFIKSF